MTTNNNIGNNNINMNNINDTGALPSKPMVACQTYIDRDGTMHCDCEDNK